MKNIIMLHPLCWPKYLLVFLTAHLKTKHPDWSMTGMPSEQQWRETSSTTPKSTSIILLTET